MDDKIVLPNRCPNCSSEEWYYPLRVPVSALANSDLLGAYNLMIGKMLEREGVAPTPGNVLRRREECLYGYDDRV